MHSVADSSEAGAAPSRMQVEIQVALNFLVSFLYNKLPRRRVNQFAEELDRALRRKFRGHWYPEKPYRGSAFRCVKTSPPLDPVFQIAARESGVDLRDVRENLPPDLSIWIDPGEVSYRIGEKGAAQVLLGGPQSSAPESRCCSTSPGSADEALVAQLAGLGLGPGANMTPLSPGSAAAQSAASAPALAAVAAVAAAAAGPCANGVPGAGAPVVNGTGTRSLTFTTASFAQTKFGSTKLKTSSKRAQRLSPTELSLRREQQQQQQQHQQQQQQQQHVARAAAAVPPPSNGNPLSPHDLYGTAAAAAAAAALPVDAFGDAAAAVVASQVAAAAAAASCPPPPTTASRFAAAASPFLAAAAAAGGSLQGHHHHHHHPHHHHHHPAVSGAAAELGAALQQHLLLAN